MKEGVTYKIDIYMWYKKVYGFWRENKTYFTPLSKQGKISHQIYFSSFIVFPPHFPTIQTSSLQQLITYHNIHIYSTKDLV